MNMPYTMSGAWLPADKVAHAAQLALDDIYTRRATLHQRNRAAWGWGRRWWHGSYETSDVKRMISLQGWEDEIIAARLVNLAIVTDYIFVSTADFHIIRQFWNL